MSVFLQPIYTQTVGSGGVAGVTFNNVPQTFTDLKIVISSRGASANFTDVLPLGFNGIYNLSATWLQGYNGAASSDRVTTASAYGVYIREPSSTATASTFSNTEIYIPNYTSSNYKSFIVDDIEENNSSTNYYTRLGAGLIPTTSAITTLNFYISNGAIVQYSTFSVYGITKG
jgi:hypothetical protein